MKENPKYYVGLDIGTDSVGYAVTDKNYNLVKFKGEQVWGVQTFEAASLARDRRAHRTERRRLDRRQQRVQLVGELFAPEICKIDPNFFIRRKESALFHEDTKYGVSIFSASGITDKEYHKKYPTIHHLINELMESSEPHDVRLVYLACAWLVANRGHFLYEIESEDIARLSNFSEPYARLFDYLNENDLNLPWSESISPEIIKQIMLMKTGIRKKQDAFKEKVFGGKKPEQSGVPSADAVVQLLCGAKVKPAIIFGKEEYADLDSVSLTMDDEQFSAALAALGEDGELLAKLRELSDCSKLIEELSGESTISKAKIKVYETHAKDLKWLKYFIKKYKRGKFYEVFREEGKENYVAYSYNVKSCASPEKVKKIKKEAFCDYLKKICKDTTVDSCDAKEYESMMERLALYTFLPKQKDTDNRVIPQQLYRYELKVLLEKAAAYLPMLGKADEDGFSVGEKILSVFDFKIPYFVGPLNPASPASWIDGKRKSGKIFPWNFESMVDFDACEDAFIRRMTNTCTYIPGEDVLPQNSLLYAQFNVLNEINNIKINGIKIPVEVKQAIYTDLFETKQKVTVKNIKDYLQARGLLAAGDEISGIDITIKSSLKPIIAFRRLLSEGTLAKQDVERIINRAAYSESKSRMASWLKAEFGKLEAADIKYITGLNLKGFGRLSEKLLNGISFVDKTTGELYSSLLEALWLSNNNMMQFMSDDYSLKEEINKLAAEYYSENPRSLSDRLDEMYISNAVKRPIIRTLDIMDDIVKALGGQPEKIFIEMARGASADQKGKRTQTRKQQLLELYKTVKTEDARRLQKELEALGDTADNKLQGDKLFLYYLQLGKCLYTGEPIDLAKLADGTYNIEHIYPQSFVKDDSVINNEILVLSTANGAKTDQYPVPAEIREKMYGYWSLLHANKLMSDEKFRRLTRTSGFTDDEKNQFINRQLVETRQSTKAVAQLLNEKYNNAEIVYVKAGLVSEFRQEFDLLKSRAANDLHHARDAYLNVVLGNVYHERFTKKWFNPNEKYNIQIKKILKEKRENGDGVYWNGQEDIGRIKQIAARSTAHITRYAFCRNGGLFDQMPVKRGSDLIPRKEGLPTEKYGGYRKPAASFFALAKCTYGGKSELMLVPIALSDAQRFGENTDETKQCIADNVFAVNGKHPDTVEMPLGARQIKVNTVFSLDGLRMTLSGKTAGGKQLIFSPASAVKFDYETELYIKHLESFTAKKQKNSNIVLDEERDKINCAENVKLYDKLIEKYSGWPFNKLPNNQTTVLVNGKQSFAELDVENQAALLLTILYMLNTGNVGDLTKIGGVKAAGVVTLSSNIANWKKNYQDVRIIDSSASGLFEHSSENILNLL